MSLRINNNVAALNGYRNLSATNVQLGKSLEKLSSGFRINRAADDAAGLVKSESLRAEINGTKGAIKNAQDGVSFVQTAEGALNEVHSILQRMRELAVDAANTATTDGVAQQAEVTELLAEITAIGTRTKFAGKDVFSNTDLLGARIRNYGRMMERRVAFSLGVTYQTPPDKLRRIPEIIRAAIEAQESTRFDRSHFKGFGSFSLHYRPPRIGRNPKTGEEIPISARRVVTFRPGQKLKARVEAYAGSQQHTAPGT